MADATEAIKRIGRLVAEYRARSGMTQVQVAEQDPSLNRTMISQLEQGLRLPAPEQLEIIFDALKIPEQLWAEAVHPEYLRAMDFQEQLSELLGKPVLLDHIDGVSRRLAVDAIAQLLSRGMSLEQSFAHFNSILTFYGEKPVSKQFFERFLGSGAFSSVSSLKGKVQDFQKLAIRLYGSFRQAFKTLRSCDDIDKELSPLREIDEGQFTQRRTFSAINKIPTIRLDDLGYISAEKVRRQSRERQELSSKLLELAATLKENPKTGLQQVSTKRINRIQSLLRKFDSPVKIETTLFGSTDPELLEREAKRIAPEDHDLARIEESQELGLRNLAAYLTEPYMDVYIATSMREFADFISVNNFVENLFANPEVAHLHLRYFNPTQSWISDRVAKGLVEALMLKRARLTVCMAQKSDTFGKDSEASVALGQGKPVIVYVPRLFDEPTGINSESLMQMSDPEFQQAKMSVELEEEEGVDRQTEVDRILSKRLSTLPLTDIARIIDNHWADFDLYGEIEELPDSQRDSVRIYLDALTRRGSSEARPVPAANVAESLIWRLVQVGLFFEKRAKTFREIHPLALQVILSSGVLNGILVVRSPAACAKVMHSLLMNRLETELVCDNENYKLIEVNTRSTLRVISKHKLLTNAFWTQYFED
ncbi:helix-turn-helix transcriptional regulator [Hyalangium sp.]|uniref:helix-turn-helix domain-containing protein n=1 Tax=Hyalangium sp. TaxID=2028555 RepID=UPI002D536FD1|nr:helix-turn-helix transcriptional regulator [Hyalangium sp.]HYH95387.1 helix-turn-helix transcriptional regulator [Hyalangium sp.]